MRRGAPLQGETVAVVVVGDELLSVLLSRLELSDTKVYEP